MKQETEENKEAKRLIEKFGDLAYHVVDEKIQAIEELEHPKGTHNSILRNAQYFWQRVKEAINNLK